MTVTSVASTCNPSSRPCTDTTVRVALTTVSVVRRARAGLARLGYCVTAAVFSCRFSSSSGGGGGGGSGGGGGGGGQGLPRIDLSLKP